MSGKSSTSIDRLVQTADAVHEIADVCTLAHAKETVYSECFRRHYRRWFGPSVVDIDTRCKNEWEAFLGQRKPSGNNANK